MFQVEIDEGSGFCFGVTTAIKKAEEEFPFSPPKGNRGSLPEPCSTVWATLSTTQWRWNASPNADS